MKKTILFLFAGVLLLISTRSVAQKKAITLEDIFTRGTFSARSVPGFNSMNNGKDYCAQDGAQNLLRYEFATGKAVDTLLRFSSISSRVKDYYSYSWSSDESKLLITTAFESVYRHSGIVSFFVFDLKNNRLISTIEEKVMNPSFSPDGNKIAYTRNNDLYYYDLSAAREVRITNDGKINSIINGSTDWVYEEEFAIWKAYAWNGNGSKLAYYRFDESKVKEFGMPMYSNSLYPEEYKFKYPKAGEANSLVQIYCYDLASGQKKVMNTGSETDIYLPRMNWTKDANTLCIQRLNRLQNKLELLMTNAATGESRVIYTEENKSYVDINDNLTFLNDGKTFLFTSEKDGWNHLYHFSLDGSLIRQITKGNWDIDDFYGVDEKKKLVYYSGTLKCKGSDCQTVSTERFIYSVSLDGKKTNAIITEDGWNSVTFNADYTFFLHSNSTINRPSRYALCDAKGKQLRVLEDNKILDERIGNYAISNAEITSYKNAYGESLNAFVIKPLNFDAAKKYPVLMYVYGGPGHQLAVNRWMGANYFWYQMLAEKGYMIVCVDGRGTGFKGEAFKKSTYLQLGKYEIEDQIFVAKELGQLPYVDASRIGIWGWSFGGYMASLGISKGADVFKTAIAVAPVTNWRYYDNIYTERFMRTPKENGNGYDDNSPINHVEKIKGNYLIIHGTADDNVHFQNTVEMVDAMIKKGVRYDSEFYPNKNHGIGGKETRFHLYDRMTRFILEKL